eukprot:scpid29669/ scgid24548/ 
MLLNPEQNQQLCMELAVTVDASLPFVTKTYLMEGDGDIVVDAYDNLQEVATAAALQNYHNTVPEHWRRNMLLLMTRSGLKRSTKKHGDACDLLSPTSKYFLQKFNHQDSPLFGIVRLFKALRLFCPLRVRKLQPGLNHVDELRLLPALDSDDTIQHLKNELPSLLVAVEDIEECPPNRLQWWCEQEKLPEWKKAARAVFCLAPSSAAAERVFSLLKASTADSQASLLEDHLEIMLLLQYNRRS